MTDIPTLPVEIKEPVDDLEVTSDRPWVVVVWNDPINTIDYVIFVLQKTFGYGPKKAEKLTMEVHNNGKSAVASGTREKSEIDVYKLHEHGLWATMEHDE